MVCDKRRVHVSKWHTCHAKWRWMSHDVTKHHACHAKRRWTWVLFLACHVKRETKVNVTKCHACHAKCRDVTGDKSGPSAPPSAICPTPATQNDGGCEFVPRLSRETKVNVTKCHPRLPRKVPRRHRRQIRTKRATQYHECHACHAKRRWMCVVCHACHVKRRWMSPSATPATQSAAASQATNPDQARHPVPCVPRLPRKTTVDASFVPRLPRETKVDVTKCHACHAKCRGVTGDKSGPGAPPSTMSATPATQNDGGCALCATPATWNEGECHQVPRLPRKVPRRHRRQIRTKRATQCHVSHACHAKRRWMRALCHACHVKRRWMSPSATPATQSAAASQATNPDQARHPVPWVPRLPRKTTVDVRCVPRLPRETKVNVTKCHACHAKCRGVTGDKSGPGAPPSTMSATPATQNDGGCEFCATPATWNEVLKVNVTKCHACHAKCRGVTGDKSGPSAPPSAMCPTPATQNAGGCELCATPATWNEGGCHQVPRLPRKVPRRHRRQIRTKRATQCHLSHACHAKRRWMRALCHTCHVKRRWMSPSATPATQSGAPPSTISATPATQNDGGCVCVCVDVCVDVCVCVCKCV